MTGWDWAKVGHPDAQGPTAGPLLVPSSPVPTVCSLFRFHLPRTWTSPFHCWEKLFIWPTPFLATKLLSFLPSELGRLMTCRTQTMLLRCAEGLYIQPLSQNGQKLSKVEPGAKEAFKQRLCDHLLVSVERLLLGVSLDWFCLLSTYDTLDTGLNTEDVAVSKTEIFLGSFSLEVSRGDGPWVNNYTDKYIVTGIVRWSLKSLRIRLMIFYVKSLAQCLVHGR